MTVIAKMSVEPHQCPTFRSTTHVPVLHATSIGYYTQLPSEQSKLP